MIIGTLVIHGPAGNRDFMGACQHDKDAAKAVYHKNMRKKTVKRLNITEKFFMHYVKDRSGFEDVISQLVADEINANVAYNGTNSHTFECTPFPELLENYVESRA